MRRVGLFVGVATLLWVMSVGLAWGDGIGPSGSFFDDDGNTHEGSIEAIRYEGITAGCNPPQNTDYCPSDDVSRSAMAAFLRRAFKLPAVDQDFFTDDDGSTFEGDINALAAAGVTRGCNPPANDRFCPDRSVTRGQMAAFLTRAFGYVDNGGGDVFVDDDDSVFEDDIDKLATAGVTKGCNPPANDRYCPDGNVKRDQMASFLARALKLVPTVPSLDHSQQNGSRLNLLVEAQDAGCAEAFLLELNGRLEVCDITVSVPDHAEFWVEHGWGVTEWSLLTPEEKTENLEILKQQSFRLFLNGTQLSTHETFDYLAEDDTMVHTFNFQFPYWFQGTHEIVGEWLDGSFVEIKVVATVDLGE